MGKDRGLWVKLWKDKHGKVVLWQNPNPLLWIWFISMLLTHLLPYGQANFAASLVSFGALFGWAYLEITSGVNYFRRSLGLIILIWTIVSRL